VAGIAPTALALLAVAASPAEMAASLRRTGSESQLRV